MSIETMAPTTDPAKYAAWSQGDVAQPNTRIPTIAAAVASGVNLNEWVYESIECSGAGSEPFTDAQFEAVAQLVAAAHKATGRAETAAVCTMSAPHFAHTLSRTSRRVSKGSPNIPG